MAALQPTAGDLYQIRIKGRLDATWSEWFDGMAITCQNGETLLEGRVIDQAALLGILAKISRLNMQVIAVQKLDE